MASDPTPAAQSCSGIAATASGFILSVGMLVVATACGAPQERADRTVPDSLAIVRADTVLSEVAGAQFARLTPTQRWRTVATLGTGLPPRTLSREDLPESDAMGAGLLSSYCVQCHWLPTPQMHSAEEWEILMRRMLLRMELLADRAEGEHIPESFTAGAQFEVVPTDAHEDSMLAYLKRNALPVVESGDLPESPAAELFVDRCTMCHQTPAPAAHTAGGWEPVLERMQQNMRLMGVDTLSGAQMDTVSSFLEEHAAASGT